MRNHWVGNDVKQAQALQVGRFRHRFEHRMHSKRQKEEVANCVSVIQYLPSNWKMLLQRETNSISDRYD